MKKLILALYAIILAVSLIGAGFDRSTEKMYLNIETGLLSFLQSGNPAEMSSENIPCDVKYSLRQIRESGKLRSIYTPDSLIDTRLSATAYKSMKKGAIFAGTFSYRNASRKNLMWLHSAENNLLMPFYLADSSSGDYNLTGITWEAAVSFSVAPY